MVRESAAAHTGDGGGVEPPEELTLLRSRLGVAAPRGWGDRLPAFGVERPLLCPVGDNYFVRLIAYGGAT